MDPLTAKGFAGLCGPSRLGKSFFLECYLRSATLQVCEVVHGTSGTHREALVSRCKMSNESTVRQAASTAPRCRHQFEARAHGGRAHGWMGGRQDGILVRLCPSAPLPLCWSFLRVIMFVTSLSGWGEEG